MSFAALPLGWLLAVAGAVAAAVVALYLLRPTPRPQLVSNIELWMRAIEKSRPRLLRSRRIPWLAFLTTLLVALLFVAELGDPRFGDDVRGTTVIVLDAGRSMGARQSRGTRLEEALLSVREWIERSTITGRVAVVRAGVDPSVVLPLTTDGADRLAALADLAVDDGPADMAAALAVADRVASAAGGEAQILVVSDRSPGVETATPQVLLPVGMPADTIAITAFSARRIPDAGGEYAVFCEVTAFSSRASRARLVILDGDVPLLDRRLTLAAGQRVAVRADGFSRAEAALTARLVDISLAGREDALAADDEAHATAPALEPLRVLLVSPGESPFLGAALSLHPGLAVDEATPEALGAGAGALSGYDVLVLDGVSPPVGLAHPAVLAFGVTGPGEPLARPRVTATMADHPALGGARLGAARIARASALPDRHAQVLLRSDRHALATATDEGGRRAVSYGFAMGDTDIATTEAFPLLLHHGLSWLARRDEVSPLGQPLGTAIAAPSDGALLDPAGDAVVAGELPRVAHAGAYRAGPRSVVVDGTEHAGPLPAGADGGVFAVTRSLPPLGTAVAAVLALLLLLEWGLLHRGRLG